MKKSSQKGDVAKSDLSEKTSHMVGRKEEIKRLRDCLRARGDRHYIYYWAQGGLGKTRLLDELQQLVVEAGPGFFSTGIIDLYHTDVHSSLDVEKAIVDGLDSERSYFPTWRRERSVYERLLERGSDPGVQEKHREALSQVFVKECRDMALEARKLVICFDTIELLQYESSVVEEKAGLGAVDTRLRSWLLGKLPQLANVLVVFCGRPKERASGKGRDHQSRLVADMKEAFGDELDVVELKPFDPEETRELVAELSGNEVIPAGSLPVVHRLTGGRPIFLHLVVDLLRALSPAPRQILDIFEEYADLVDAPAGDPRLHEARRRIEVEILRGIFNEAGELGGYLGRMAMMPKGVNAAILEQVLGLPTDEVDLLLQDLRSLSFVKVFKSAPGTRRLPEERTFFHDEMYRLLNLSDVVPNLRMNERTVAHQLIVNYYNRRIADLEIQISDCEELEDRSGLRERLQRLQLERLYYFLVRDPRQGYLEYKRLTEEANRRRWLAFGMQLLDEFLRFYNSDPRRGQFDRVHITHQQVVRESAQTWVERFHWWGQYLRAIDFARQILDHPETFSIDPTSDVAVLGNVCALWSRARAMHYGYEKEVYDETHEMLKRLPPLADCNDEQTLARARLCTSLGYQSRWGGHYVLASRHYVEGVAAFRKLKTHEDELAIVLNNLAWVYARQGRFRLARILGSEALAIDKKEGTDYSTGLTLTNLAYVERMAGGYPQAVIYAEQALELFRDLEDPHGTVRAYINESYSKRKTAKVLLEQGAQPDELPPELEQARIGLENALFIAQEAGLQAEVPGIKAELGKVYREMGLAVTRLEGATKGMTYYRKGEDLLEEALKSEGLAKGDRADCLQDLAELLQDSADPQSAQERLNDLERLIGDEYTITLGKVPHPDLATELFLPLGKAERLRGDIDFDIGEHAMGMEHYVLAYAYFARFSPVTIERDRTIEQAYARLRGLSLEEQKALCESAAKWAAEYNDPRAEVKTLAEELGHLLGVAA